MFKSTIVSPKGIHEEKYLNIVNMIEAIIM